MSRGAGQDGGRESGHDGRATLAPAGASEPQRTCVGCRHRASRSVLLRVVASEIDGKWYVDPDPGRRRAGRGAWVHHDLGCLEAAERRSAFTRALQRGGPMSTDRLRKHLETHDVARHEGTPSESEAGLKLMSTR